MDGEIVVESLLGVGSIFYLFVLIILVIGEDIL